MKKSLTHFLLFNLHLNEDELRINQQFIFLNNVFFFAAFVALGMGFIRLQHSVLLGMIDFGFSILSFGLLYYSHHHKEHIQQVSTLALIIAFILFYSIYLLAPYNTLRLSVFVLLSVSAFFLKGRKAGFLWIVFIIFSIILGHVIPHVNTAYSWFDILFMCLNLTALFFIFDNYDLVKKEQTDYLERLNVDLEKKVQARTRKLRLSNKTLEDSEKRFRSAFDYAAIGMALVSLEGRWLKVNKSLCNILGYTEEELLKIDFQHITYPDDLQTDLKYVHQLLEGKIDTYQMEKRYLCKNGSIIWALLSVSLHKNAKGKPLYFIAQVQNIDTQKKAEQELVKMAYQDPLTGLANRKQLEQSFIISMAYAKRHHQKIAVLFMDLDFFKKVNDTFGHDTGDLLLIEIAVRLKSCVRASDIVGRQGGDEFLILLSEIVKKEEIRNIIKLLFHVITEPVILKEHIITITPSIGISLYPQDGLDIETLIKHADAALYEVKSGGRNNYTFYHSDYHATSSIIPRIS